jgi:ADP-dependent NAD(P)H-hydrate dehydratase / NAD(P)H-hydrate epimerase
MQIFATEKIRAWDEYTIHHEPVSSLDLMERAAAACFEWLTQEGYNSNNFSIYCAKGNNGGDGLAIARMLAQSGHRVKVNILEFGHKGTDDFQSNLARLHETVAEIRFISEETAIYPPEPGDILIDALFGSGLNRPLDGLSARLVEHMNASGQEIIAIDIPSGLFVDRSSRGNTVIKASHTLSFQCYKPALLVPENAEFFGEVHILDIGLHPGFLKDNSSSLQWIDAALVKTILRPRKKFAHKGDFGHAALAAGSAGMMGAAVLCARACLRAGVGKLTVHIPSSGNNIMQVAVPEAMCMVEDGVGHINSFSAPEKYNAIGIGPGIGQHEQHAGLLEHIFQHYHHPLVIDADGLNVLAKHNWLLIKIPANSVLTPHPKEFERLFGKTNDDFHRLSMALDKAAFYKINIILKGHHTFIATPGGTGYFNSTGNAGMATGGTGDVLTGIITALVAQGYDAQQAAIAGTYIHGLAGDLAASCLSPEALVASDIIDYLGNAFAQLVR